VLLDDVLFSRSANDTVEVGRSHAFAASELVLGSQGGFWGGLPRLTNEEGSSAAAALHGNDLAGGLFSGAAGPSWIGPPTVTVPKSHYDNLLGCKDMLEKLLPEYRKLGNENAMLRQEGANLQSRYDFESAAHARESQLLRQAVENIKAEFVRGKSYMEQQVCLERAQVASRLNDLAKKHAEDLEKLREANATRIAQIHLEHDKVVKEYVETIASLKSSDVDAWYQDTTTQPHVNSVPSKPVVFDMDVEVGVSRQISGDGNSNTLVDAASRLLQRITGNNTHRTYCRVFRYNCRLFLSVRFRYRISWKLGTGWLRRFSPRPRS
jgi:hypothetical protein